METPTKRPGWVNIYKHQSINIDLWAAYEEAIAMLNGEKSSDEGSMFCLVDWDLLDGQDPNLTYGDWLQAELEQAAEWMSEDGILQQTPDLLRLVAAMLDEQERWLDEEKQLLEGVQIEIGHDRWY